MSSKKQSEPENNIRFRGSKTDSAESVIRDMSAEKFKERLQGLQQNTLLHMDEHLSTMVGEVMKEIEKCGVSKEFNELLCLNKGEKKSEKLREKVFVARNSLLSDLFEIKHMQTIYHIFIAMLIVLLLQSVVVDYITKGTINLCISTMALGFQNFQAVLLIWLVMFTSTLVSYYPFSIWATVRMDLSAKSGIVKIWDWIGLVGFIVYQSLFCYAVLFMYYRAGEFYFPSSMAILCEQIRFLMKTYAFVRSNVPKIRAYKPHSSEKCTFPGFSYYLYFLFAPTLVYRDSYPRTKEVRWGRVVWNFFEVLMAMFFMAFLIEKFLLPYSSKFGLEPLNTKQLIIFIFGMMVPGLLMFVSAFYLLLHAWSNAWAEALRFADRMFYNDWWNSCTYSEYYRTWNNIVHDWLYTYIYRDMYDFVAPKNRVLAALVVFLVSAIVHEYILVITFSFFYPIMMVFFGGLGVPLSLLMKPKSKHIGNIFLWFSLASGNGLMMAGYALEYYARLHCAPTSTNTFIDLVSPRSWACHKL